MAALGVAVFHIGQGVGLDLHTGAAGVDLFFVISGFVMWLVTADRESRPGVFLWRRVRRVAPFYWLVTLIAVAIALASPLVRSDVRPTPEHVALSLAFIPHYSPAGLPFPALAQGWTLVYEALFYGVFAAALLLPRNLQFLTVTLALSAIAVIGIGYPPIYMLLANPLLGEFIFGMGLGRAWLSKGLPPARWGLAWMILGTIALFASFPIGGDDPGNWRVLVWGLPATAIVGGALAIDRAGRWPPIRWLEAVGDASYALYLTHRLTMTGVYLLLGAVPLILMAPATMLATITVALIVHRWVEKPMLKAMKL